MDKKTGVKLVFLLSAISILILCSDFGPAGAQNSTDQQINQMAQQKIDEGRKIFRFETFGDEAFWGQTLKLHNAIQGSKFGGVGGGVSPDEAYRTTPLRGAWARHKGGYYHDGRFATFMDVVNHYNNFGKLNLSGQERNDLVEFLKSL
jgi:cytochrome c peroxidase